MTTTQTDPQLRSWRGVPIETRRAERRELLVDAAFELLGTECWNGTTIRGVCQAARLNPRYFYESFDDLESLFLAIFDRLTADALLHAVRAIADIGDDPADRARAVIDATVRFLTDDPRRARILFVEALGNEVVGRRRLDTMHATAEFLEQYSWSQTGMAQDRMGIVASHLLVGGLTQLVLTWLGGNLNVTIDELVEDAAALMVAVGAVAEEVAMGRQPAAPRND
jgi:AcrR family transcriptional regulator